jgi:hypothetical protein
MSEPASPSPWFILGSNDSSGRSSTERVSAPTAEVAIETLAARGHTNVKLLVDTPDRLNVPVSDAARQKTDQFVTAKDYFRITQQSSLGNVLSLFKRMFAPSRSPFW